MRPSAWEQLDSHWTDFNKIIYLRIFRKSFEKFQISLKSDNGYFTRIPIYMFVHISLSSCYNEMFQTKVVQKIRLPIVPSVTFLKNFVVYEIMWKNIVEGARPHMTIWRVRIACWITKVTNTHSGYVMVFLLFHCTMVARTRLIVTLYVHFACLVYFVACLFSM